ncbi:uncharacterized protein LOC125661534 [Ostrea edulis]|uniref:uncharacterized protein LOC125661534 n=1 Tax=Ostrea edulis TaxID=37623 RepID=UPI002094D1C4|nr:uncharacterized protein LOC125661534 [Ostrea edulis]
MASGDKDMEQAVKKLSISESREVNDSDLAEDSEPWVTQLPELTGEMQTLKIADGTEPWIARSPESTEMNKESQRANIRAVVIHAYSDNALTRDFINEFKRYIPNVTIQSQEESAIPGRTVFENFESDLEQNDILFVMVTNNLKLEPNIESYFADIGLFDSQMREEKRGKFIPIWGDKNAKYLYKKFAPLHGFDFGQDKFSKLNEIIQEIRMCRDDEFDDLK